MADSREGSCSADSAHRPPSAGPPASSTSGLPGAMSAPVSHPRNGSVYMSGDSSMEAGRGAERRRSRFSLVAAGITVVCASLLLVGCVGGFNGRAAPRGETLLGRGAAVELQQLFSRQAPTSSLRQLSDIRAARLARDQQAVLQELRESPPAAVQITFSEAAGPMQVAPQFAQAPALAV
ncbi:hypothetical protein T484DRAFT_1908671 [Baffinella frigidus]|nr:hypothetical protein T484DRAFT_1908671 [Cryptophyta sp. CCMP2293]